MELEEGHIKRFNIPIVGIIEKNVEFFSPRVSEVLASIGGELINDAAALGLDNLVESYIIGAMNAQAAAKYLKQVNKFALITGGDRTDLSLAGLVEDISCLILTGFMQPDIKVIIAVNEKKVPIILSPSDTYTTLRNLNRLKPGIQQDEISKVLVIEFIDWELLLS